jgi:hypothetical protein
MSADGVIAVVQMVGAGLEALGRLAPSVVEVFTGGRPVGELVDEALRRARELPVRTGSGGTWEADLAARKARGEP